MIRNEIENLIETLNDLSYDVLLLESELKNCEDQSLGEDLFNQLLEKKTELAVFKDINGLV